METSGVFYKLNQIVELSGDVALRLIADKRAALVEVTQTNKLEAVEIEPQPTAKTKRGKK